MEVTADRSMTRWTLSSRRALSTCRSLTGLTAVRDVLDPLVMPGQGVVARPVTSFQT
ncbi:MAG: hypothetical protein QOE37_2350, partial [Microbacteriaceae bacterium]|nr:hypothetical protein [Microbacteriaceae bacterium]